MLVSPSDPYNISISPSTTSSDKNLTRKVDHIRFKSLMYVKIAASMNQSDRNGRHAKKIIHP